MLSFSSIRYSTLPLPVPLDPDLIEIQLEFDSAVHAHPGCVRTSMSPFRARALTERKVGSTE